MRPATKMFAPLAFLALLLVGPAGGTEPPVAAIETLHASLIESMMAGRTWSCAERASRLAGPVAASYDFETIGRHLLRKQWSSLDGTQQARYVEALEALAVANYTGNFTRHAGESFETLGSEAGPGGTRLVRTRLMRSGPPVSLDYLLRERAGQWRIVNVIAEGVSDLAVRSTQYDRALRERGADGLIAFIGEQAAKALALCS